MSIMILKQVMDVCMVLLGMGCRLPADSPIGGSAQYLILFSGGAVFFGIDLRRAQALVLRLDPVSCLWAHDGGCVDSLLCIRQARGLS